MNTKPNMEIYQQETNQSQIEQTLISKQHDNKMGKDKLCLKSPPSSDVIIIIDDDEEEKILEPEKKKPRLGYSRVRVDAFDELSIVVNGKQGTREYNNNVASRADSCFSFADLNEKKTEEKSDHVENVVESSTSNKGYGHVSLDDLGVSVEDLKSIPWEAFDPTWEIRSWVNDPWLGGYIEDMFPPQNNSDT